MGENNSKWSNWQTTNLKNIQATPTAQLQKNNWPNQKMGQRTRHFFFVCFVFHEALSEKAMATQSSTLAWKIPWREEPGRLQSMGSERRTRLKPSFHFSVSGIGEGNGNPLQCSCLENPRVGELGQLPSMGLHRVGHKWSDLAAAVAWGCL